MSAEREDLAAQLAAADAAQGAGGGLAAADRRRTRVLGATIGLSTAALLLLTVYVPVDVSLVGWVAGMVGYGIVLAVVITWYTRTRRAVARGFSLQYGLGLGGTMLLYMLGIVSSTAVEARDWWIWVPAAVLVALPSTLIPSGARR
ncbi:hypothetical protein [Arenivirga flava]|uniref:Uncharacterized protein n=1 Tax=Arenivirga flava TaxID=1930060 RepID=A0AA37UNJ1_9MICO|nr:hypothetical protein [Arenivirga flava]GMA26902.1 hypothetical protein GCM10025874_01550 [Arenivirga flava]